MVRVTDVRRGFTLVEMLVVLVLVGLLSGTAAVMVRQPLSRARRQFAISQLQLLDLTARERSRQGKWVRLTFDLKEQRVELRDERGESRGQPLVLKRKEEQIHRILGAEKNADDTFSITFDRYGMSPTYAVGVGASEPDWLLVLGVTGQTYLFKDANEIQTIISRERNHTP